MNKPGKKMLGIVNETLLYALIIEFHLFGSVWAMLDVKGMPYLLLYWGFIGLGLLKLCIQGNSWKDWVLISGLGIIAILSWQASGDKTSLLLILSICCGKDMKLDRVIKADLVAQLIAAPILILFPLFGICENHVVFMRGVKRMFFGWQAANGMGLSFLSVCMEWMYFRHHKFRWFDYVGITGMLVFLHVTANSRTAEILIIGILLAETMTELWNRYVKKPEEYQVWTVGCALALGMDLVMPSVAMLLYVFKKQELMALSGTFIARFQLAGTFWEKHGWSLFGRPYTPGIYDYLDMLYAYLTLHLGIVMAVLVLVLTVKTIFYGYQKKNEKFLLFFMIILLRSVVESEHFNLVYGFFSVLLGLGFWNRGIWKLKDRKK